MEIATVTRLDKNTICNFGDVIVIVDSSLCGFGLKFWAKKITFSQIGYKLTVYSNGFQIWSKNNEPWSTHRDGGPAVVEVNREIWFKHGARHRVGGPAYIATNGYKKWYQNGKLHRDAGPAIIRPIGENDWYTMGVKDSYRRGKR